MSIYFENLNFNLIRVVKDLVAEFPLFHAQSAWGSKGKRV